MFFTPCSARKFKLAAGRGFDRVKFKIRRSRRQASRRFCFSRFIFPFWFARTKELSGRATSFEAGEPRIPGFVKKRRDASFMKIKKDDGNLKLCCVGCAYIAFNDSICQ